MTIFFNVFLPVVLVAGLAALLQRLVYLDARTVARAAFYLFGPALVFDSLASSDVGAVEFGQISVVLIGVTAVMWALAEGAGRLLHLQAPTHSAFLLSILLMNAGNFGLPIVLFAFGDAGLARASLYYAISAALSNSLGVFLAARGSAPASVAARRLLKVPLLYASVLGLVLNLAHVNLPTPFLRAVHLLGQASVPTMLVALGMQLAQTFSRGLGSIRKPALAVAVAGRLIVAPALTLVAAYVLGMPGLTRQVVAVEAGMPSAVIATILAAEFDCDVDFVALTVFVTTAISLITLATLLYWFT